GAAVGVLGADLIAAIGGLVDRHADAALAALFGRALGVGGHRAGGDAGGGGLGADVGAVLAGLAAGLEDRIARGRVGRVAGSGVGRGLGAGVGGRLLGGVGRVGAAAIVVVTA